MAEERAKYGEDFGWEALTPEQEAIEVRADEETRKSLQQFHRSWSSMETSMASEVLAVPEEHLLEVIAIIRAGLRSTSKVTPEVKRQLTKWCKAEERYALR